MGECPLKGMDFRDLIDGRVDDEMRENLIRHLALDCPNCDRIFAESLDEKEAIFIALMFEKKTFALNPVHEHQKSRIYQEIIKKDHAEERQWIHAAIHFLEGALKWALKWDRPAALALALPVLVLVSVLVYRFIQPSTPYYGIKGVPIHKISLSGWVGSETNGKKI